MPYLGSWKINDVVTFNLTTYSPITGQAQAADSTPIYRVYENITATPLVTGNFATLDAGNVTGFYAAQITLTAASGFEVTKTYTIIKQHVTGSITRVETEMFQIEAAVRANTVADKTGYALTSGERSAIVAALLATADAIESGATFKDTIKLIAAAVFGKGSNLSATNPTYSSTDIAGGIVIGTKSRIVVSGADAAGNRPAITVDVS